MVEGRSEKSVSTWDEGWRDVANHHLIYQDTKGPPVDGLCIALRFKQFWGNVLGCTTEGWNTNVRWENPERTGRRTICPVGFGHIEFAETEIT